MFGVILGVVLTVVGAYAYDTTTGRASNGLPPSAANEHPPMVNWDVVSDISRCQNTSPRRRCGSGEGLETVEKLRRFRRAIRLIQPSLVAQRLQELAISGVRSRALPVRVASTRRARAKV